MLECPTPRAFVFISAVFSTPSEYSAPPNQGGPLGEDEFFSLPAGGQLRVESGLNRARDCVAVFDSAVPRNLDVATVDPRRRRALHHLRFAKPSELHTVPSEAIGH